ncbi:MAG: 30S ribosomal protein S20 [Actinomycetota bacterium]|nr:30S ribosomal protein S20 [Actinomycetota bacterium]MDI6821471.1 30S ribosomal protein S20 [Actinomycetota bacterium]
MAQIKSQIKRIRQAEKRRLRNKSVKSAIKTHISKFNEAVESKDKDSAKEALGKAIKALDKAVSKGVIHLNSAANKKSKLVKKFNTL